MNKAKNFLAVMLLALVVGLCTPQAFAGPSETPGIMADGPSETPGITCMVDGPSETPGIMAAIIQYLASMI